MISHKYILCKQIPCRPFIFVHIPRCGGTSVENVLFKPRIERTRKDLWSPLKKRIKKKWRSPNKYQTGGLQHLKASHIIQEVGVGIFNNCFKFSFVRNPWDKAVSDYYFIIKKRKVLRNLIGIDANSTFSEYLQRVLEAEIHVQWDCQYKFLYDSKGIPLVDFIGKLENLQEDFNTVCDKIGIPQQKLPHENQSNPKRKHYTEYYDEEGKQIVAEKYAKDIEYFGYKFGE